MITFLGIALFGLIFMVLVGTGSNGGAIGSKTGEMMEWLHYWAPYSYIILALLFLAIIGSVHLMHSWPKHVEPDDPMRKYRHPEVEDVMED